MLFPHDLTGTLIPSMRGACAVHAGCRGGVVHSLGVNNARSLIVYTWRGWQRVSLAGRAMGPSPLLWVHTGMERYNRAWYVMLCLAMAWYRRV